MDSKQGSEISLISVSEYFEIAGKNGVIIVSGFKIFDL